MLQPKTAALSLALAILATMAAPLRAEEVYTVGVTGALTGPLADIYLPVMDGMRLYVDRVNAAGGIQGKKINLLIRDDQSEASKGAANVRRLLTQDKAQLLVNASASTTYQPSMAEAQRATVPLLFVGVCPAEVYPPAKPLMFCTNSFASHYDSRAALDFIREAAGTTNLSVGLMSQSVPIARAEIDYAEVRSREIGMRPVDKELLPPATADFTPFATKLTATRPDWIWSWTAWDLQTSAYEAIRRLGWTGYFLGWSHIQAEDSLPALKDTKFYTIGTNLYFQYGLPVHKEIEAAARAANIAYPASRLAEGWISGMVIEAALKAAGAPGSPQKIAAAMEHLTVDTRGLRGGPIEWTPENHFRKRQSYRVYRWNGSVIEAVGDWRHYDVTGAP
jgi:ABC-type branched-subunit amino acid transport system substrate-binding protein